MKNIFSIKNFLRISLIILIFLIAGFIINQNIQIIKRNIKSNVQNSLKKQLINNSKYQYIIADIIAKKLKNNLKKYNTNLEKYIVEKNNKSKEIIIKSILKLNPLLYNNIQPNTLHKYIIEKIKYNKKNCKSPIWQSFYKNLWKIKYEYYVKNSKNNQIKRIEEFTLNHCYNIDY